MFRKILYPTDFSDVANKALDYLIKFKEAGTEEVVILHVVDTRSLHIPEVYSLMDLSLLGEKQEIAARDKADKIAGILANAGIRTAVRIETGIPFKEILRAESEEDISLIVIGSHGVSNVKEMLLGSVSEKVVRKARKPVLIVKR
ncbi:universal stress protein [Syntrophus aciditrophicus]|uniref:Universal stress protein family n=1 Tax=Syntrophus aciditrophicus (strain SB) TaxID=56780 RepID=Q2LTD9_SYNAS|nr:universal stress protein [Syntrophus aciditrophicus]ABC77345.1 universal stress protein family [Syntrophus aciditrophicus SB]OPY17484.1 MAG: putative universal stress protein [Syntrophus sp. PtaB.Bin075]